MLVDNITFKDLAITTININLIAYFMESYVAISLLSQKSRITRHNLALDLNTGQLVPIKRTTRRSCPR